jgi:predicted O-methyltransferase YrrM
LQRALAKQQGTDVSHFGSDFTKMKITSMNRNNLVEVMNLMGLKKGAEVGVQRGLFSEKLCQGIEDCELFCIDPWIRGGDDFYRTTEERLAPYNATLIRALSVDGVRQFAEKSLDFVFIDGAHDFDNVMLDLVLWSRRVRKGGIIAGHDYDEAHKGLVLAVDTYTQWHKIKPWFTTKEKITTTFFWER